MEYYQEHRAEVIAKSTLWNQSNPARRKKIIKTYNDSEARREASSRYYLNNMAKIKAKTKAYANMKRATDPNFKMMDNLRRRLRSALNGQNKTGSAVTLLGCPVPLARLILEAQFFSGMTWDNYGVDWHIDHKKALSKYNLEDPTQLADACHISNLQPLWAEDNRRKYNKCL